MDLDLESNGILDEYDEFEKVGLDYNDYLPVIHLYFCDGLTAL
jgi:hypothetical protein